MNRRSFLRSILATAAVATGLATTRLEVLDERSQFAKDFLVYGGARGGGNSDFSEIVARTLRERSGEVADNVMRNNLVLAKLNREWRA